MNVMGIVILSIGTILSVVYIVLLFKGRDNDYMLEPLDSDAFPLKFLYSAGFALQETRLGRLRGKLGSKLRDEAAMYYGKKYAEFYARAIWAQTLSIALAAVAVMFLTAGLFSGEMCTFFALMGVALGILAAYYFITYTSEKLKTRRDECADELPNAISKLALLVNSGTTLHAAWKMVAFGKDGVIYDLMREACQRMDNGKPEIDAIYDFGSLSGSQEVKKFTSALLQSMERGGGGELSQFLENQSAELWGQRRQRLLQKGEQAASALLMPISLMFIGVMLIVLVSAIQSFSL